MTSKRSTKGHVDGTNRDNLYCSKLSPKPHLTSLQIEELERANFRCRFDFFVKRVVALRCAFCLEDDEGIFLASNSPEQGIIPLWASYEHACIMQRLSEVEDWKKCWVEKISLNRLLRLAREADVHGDAFVVFPLASAPGAEVDPQNLLSCLQQEKSTTRDVRR